MRKFLFVCTGNTCRSPMAEGIFNSLGFNATAKSAGLFVTDQNVSENSVAVCSENGIDISSHIPTQITTEMISDADVILTMTSSHKAAFGDMDKVFTVAEYFGENQDVSDPYGGSLDDYRHTFSRLKSLIGNYHED